MKDPLSIESQNKMRKALREAKVIFGSYAEIARMCEVSRQAVGQWYDTYVPCERAIQISQFSEEFFDNIKLDNLPPKQQAAIKKTEAFADRKIKFKRLYPENLTRQKNRG